jgi:hypothetical protein
MRIESFTLENVGPIREAQIAFGDLTVLVGPQATGKSIFLQFLKLFADAGAIQSELKQYGSDWRKDLPAFLDLFLGEGMHSVWKEGKSNISLNGDPQSLDQLVGRSQRRKEESLFLIPAQRVLTLRDGWPRPFSDYGSGDPFTVRHFSERLRRLMDSEWARESVVFPRTRRFKTVLRDMLSSNVFGQFDLRVETTRSRKRLVLGRGKSASLPFMVWSAGQREFVPLLLGLYWLIPPTKVSRKGDVNWVVIEEPEMGLHPKATTVVLLLILELLSRDYRVCLSTHSPHVLDFVWGMGTLQRHGADPRDLLTMLEAETTQPMMAMARAVLQKQARVYFFNRESGIATDISTLDPAAANPIEAGWGGLSEFSGRVASTVASVVGASVGGNRNDL